MDSAFLGIGALGLLGTLVSTLFFLALGILWVLVPFAIFGIKPLLRDLISEQRKTQALLIEIGKKAASN